MMDVGKYVDCKINQLEVSKNAPNGKALYACLSSNAGKSPGEDPKMWGILLEDISESMISKTGEPTYSEWAIHLALTLYATHQQHNDQNVYCKGVSLGKAASELLTEYTEEEKMKIINRLAPIMMARNIKQAAYHLRGLILMFKQKDISLDYAMLADDLFLFQTKHKKRVQLRWGQDFYHFARK